METDVLGGVQLGFKTILVLSGNMKAEDLPNYAFHPDKIVESLADLSHASLTREFTLNSPASVPPAPWPRPQRRGRTAPFEAQSATGSGAARS